MGVCIYFRGRETTEVAIPSRTICICQPLVPVWPAMTSPCQGMAFSSALAIMRSVIQVVMLGPMPMAGPFPSSQERSLGPSGVRPWVTSTATHQSGATA